MRVLKLSMFRRMTDWKLTAPREEFVKKVGFGEREGMISCSNFSQSSLAIRQAAAFNEWNKKSVLRT